MLFHEARPAAEEATLSIKVGRAEPDATPPHRQPGPADRLEIRRRQTRHMSETSSSDRPHVVASSTVTMTSSDLLRLMRSGRTRVLVLPE